MAAKYSSHAAFQYGVANVNAELTDGERMILYSLAVAADYRTGLSHPGNFTMMRQSNRTERGVRDIIQRLIAKTLIERVSVGDGGRGLATEYRIRVEDDRFPEPRAKPGSNKCRVIHMKPGSNGCPVSHAKPGSGERETRQCDPENPAVQTAAHPINPSSIPSEAKSDDEGGLNSKSKTKEIYDWFEDASANDFGSPIVLTARIRSSLTAVAAEAKATPDMIKAALVKIAKRKQGWNGINSRQAIILSEFPAVLRNTPRPPTPEEIEAKHAADELRIAQRRAEDDRIWKERERDRKRREFLDGQGLAREDHDAALKDPDYFLWKLYDDPPMRAVAVGC